MLRELHIANLAVITDVRIDLHAGLNCFTGATGAGKSLIIGAVELLLGLRSAAEMIRPGVDEARISGVFELANPPLLTEIARITDVPVTADGGEILLTRKIHASGRSSISLNGNPITLGMLKQLAERLVDVHGQHDHQYLLRPSNQLEVIDQFGDLEDLRQRYHAVFGQLLETRRRLDELSTSQSLRQQKLELYRFQAQEIDAAELDAGEYAELEARASVLANLEKLKKDATAAHAAMYEADGSVVERMKMASGILAELAELDASLKPIAQSAKDATLQLEDCAFDLSRYLDRLDLDPAELGEVNDRLNVINRVLSKYGNNIESALAHRQQIGQEISDLENAGGNLAELQAKLKPLGRELAELGNQLTGKRKAVIAKLAPSVEKSLAELGMEKAKFTIALEPAAGAIAGLDLPATPSGFDAVEFIAQTNPGQLAQPLRKIASGGELSRIMLALKGILAAGDRISVLVFDEIDANVGGRLGAIIGGKLRDLANHHQVVCITHLPQIASYADRHLTVRKEISGKSTQTTVRVMQGEERVRELAEMIGGTRITETTLAQAREMIESAEPPAAKPAKKKEKERIR